MYESKKTSSGVAAHHDSLNLQKIRFTLIKTTQLKLLTSLQEGEACEF